MKSVASILTCVAVFAVLAGTVSLARADRIPGPGNDTKVCQAYGSVTYYEQFRGGWTARVALVGDGSTDLDVFVYDLQGRLVAQGTGPTDIELVSWFPVRTQTYRIVVRNLGGTWNRYSIATN
jgi:hypothetical protein